MCHFFGTIAGLLSLREAILKLKGYEVFTATKPVDAATRIRQGDCDVLLMCYSVRKEWREALMRDFRQYCPAGRIVLITNVPMKELPQGVDELVYGLEGAEALIDAVRNKAA